MYIRVHSYIMEKIEAQGTILKLQLDYQHNGILWNSYKEGGRSTVGVGLQDLWRDLEELLSDKRQNQGLAQ